MNKLILAILLALPTTYVYAEEIPTMPTVTMSRADAIRSNYTPPKSAAELHAETQAMLQRQLDIACPPECAKANLKRMKFAETMNRLGVTDGLRAYNRNREVDAIISEAKASAERNGLLVK